MTDGQGARMETKNQALTPKYLLLDTDYSISPDILHCEFGGSAFPFGVEGVVVVFCAAAVGFDVEGLGEGFDYVFPAVVDGIDDAVFEEAVVVEADAVGGEVDGAAFEDYGFEEDIAIAGDNGMAAEDKVEGCFLIGVGDLPVAVGEAFADCGFYGGMEANAEGFVFFFELGAEVVVLVVVIGKRSEANGYKFAGGV